MNPRPTRTGETNLTDGELLLFDFLFQYHVRRQALERETYSLHMNCGYSHALVSAELDETLQSLVRRKLIWTRRVDDPHEHSYTLTATGGSLWERERRADWNSYVDPRQGLGGTNQSVLALHETVTRQYLGGCFAFGSIVVTGKIRTKMIRRCKLLPWRVFDTVAVARVPIQPKLDHVWIDYDAFDENRTWWQTVHELDTLNERAR